MRQYPENGKVSVQRYYQWLIGADNNYVTQLRSARLQTSSLQTYGLLTVLALIL